MFFFYNIFFNTFFNKLFQEEEESLDNENEVPAHEKDSDDNDKLSKRKSESYKYYTWNSSVNRWCCNYCE